MKGIGYFLLTAFLLIILVGGMSCQSKTTPQYTTATPEGTIRLYLDAQCQLDAEKVAQRFVNEDREKIRTDAEQGFEQIYSFSVEKVKIKIASQTEDTARVIVRCDKIISPAWSNGEYQDIYKDQVNEFDLVKQGDEWLIKLPLHSVTPDENGTESTPSVPQPVYPGEEPTSTQSTQEEKVLHPTDLGLVFWRLDGEKYIAYGIGKLSKPRGGTFLLYEFPLFISRTVGGGPWETIITIPDPDIEIGGGWESPLITDPDYNVTLKVKLIRVEEVYKYKVMFFASPSWSEKWFPPTIYPSPGTFPRK